MAMTCLPFFHPIFTENHADRPSSFIQVSWLSAFKLPYPRLQYHNTHTTTIIIHNPPISSTVAATSSAPLIQLSVLFPH